MNAGTPMLRPARHERVWLNTDVAATGLVRAANPQQAECIVAHAAHGCPFVARRRQPCDPAGLVHLGLRLPPEAMPRSIGFSVPAHAIRTSASALSAHELLATQNFLSPSWRTALQDLDHALAARGLQARLYGSLAWQFSSGNRYLTDTSDIDLLLYPLSPDEADACLTELAAVAVSVAPRFDGELCLPDGRAVSWRELMGGSRQILVKTEDGVALADRTSIWSDLTWQAKV
ncbi:MAG: mdcG1 [Herbaspirillum sp.]|nr:mdcG1 [Herbaspirillum sp.]